MLKENKKLVEAKNALERVARERAAASEKIEKSIDTFKSKAAAAAAAAAAAEAKTKQSLQAQADMQTALSEAKRETAAAKAEAAAVSKKLETIDRKRALGDSELAILETEAMDDNPEALKHKCPPLPLPARHTPHQLAAAALALRVTSCHVSLCANSPRLEILFRARAEDRKRAAREMKEFKANAEAQVLQPCRRARSVASAALAHSCRCPCTGSPSPMPYALSGPCASIVQREARRS